MRNAENKADRMFNRAKIAVNYKGVPTLVMNVQVVVLHEGMAIKCQPQLAALMLPQVLLRSKAAERSLCESQGIITLMGGTLLRKPINSRGAENNV